MTARTQFYSHLLSVAERGDTITDADFADCCYRAVSEHGFDPKSLMAEIEIGASSFERWMTGANLPHPVMRGKILLTMAHILKPN